jgi:hypothetical protein
VTRPKSVAEAVVFSVATVAAVTVLGIVVAHSSSSANGTTSSIGSGFLIWIVVGGVLAFGMSLGYRYLTVRKHAQVELAGSEQYRKLAEEYRRLADVALSTQEHTDLKLGELSAQLDYLREQTESLHKILKDVE